MFFASFCPAGSRATPARWQETINTCSSSSARRGSRMSWRPSPLLSPPAPPALHSEYCRPGSACLEDEEIEYFLCFFFLLFFLKTKNKNHDVHFCAGWGKAARTEKTLWATSVAGRLFSISSPRSTSPSGRTMTSALRELTSSAESPASTGSGCRSEAKLVLCNEKKQFASKIAFLFLSRWLTQWTAVCSQQWEKSLTLWDPSCGTLSTRRSTCRAVTFTGRCWDQLTLQSEPCGVE